MKLERVNLAMKKVAYWMIPVCFLGISLEALAGNAYSSASGETRAEACGSARSRARSKVPSGHQKTEGVCTCREIDDEDDSYWRCEASVYYHRPGPSGTNTPPQQSTYQVPRRQVLITPGFN